MAEDRPVPVPEPARRQALIDSGVIARYWYGPLQRPRYAGVRPGEERGRRVLDDTGTCGHKHLDFTRAEGCRTRMERAVARGSRG